MRSSLLLGLVVVVLLVVTVPPCNADTTINKILWKVNDVILYNLANREVSFLRHPCRVESKKQPGGVYKAVMSCDSWTSKFVGEGKSMVELQALKGAIRSFIKQAAHYQMLTAADIEDWLASYFY